MKTGDRFVELGTGSGYGAALASHIVSPAGQVFSVEIDPVLAGRAARLLQGYSNVQVACGDAADSIGRWRGSERISVTFAVDEIPTPWLDALPEGGRLVAPVGKKPRNA